MAFNSANFDIHTTTSSLPTIYPDGYVWKYTTSDNISAIDNHYFDAAGDKVRKYDWISVQAADGDALFIVDGANIFGPTVTTNYKFVEGQSLSGYFTF